MGRNLQIRVTATTFRPEDVARDWPRLVHLAWRGEQALPGAAPRGVLELARDLADVLRLEAPPEVRRALEADAARAQALADELDAALADWNPARANALSERLEALLDELEPLAPEAPFIVSRPRTKL
jgi:hypothetical protein